MTKEEWKKLKVGTRIRISAVGAAYRKDVTREKAYTICKIEQDIVYFMGEQEINGAAHPDWWELASRPPVRNLPDWW